MPGGLEDWPRDTPHPGPGRETHLEDGRTVDSVCGRGLVLNTGLRHREAFREPSRTVS